LPFTSTAKVFGQGGFQEVHGDHVGHGTGTTGGTSLDSKTQEDLANRSEDLGKNGGLGKRSIRSCRKEIMVQRLV